MPIAIKFSRLVLFYASVLVFTYTSSQTASAAVTYQLACEALILKVAKAQHARLESHTHYLKTQNSVSMRVGAEMDQDSSLNVTGAVVSFGSGADLFRPLIAFPLAKEIHLVDTWSRWLRDDSPELALREIENRAKHLAPDAKVKTTQEGFRAHLHEDYLGRDPWIFEIEWTEFGERQHVTVYAHAIDFNNETQMLGLEKQINVIDRPGSELQAVLLTGTSYPRDLYAFNLKNLAYHGWVVLEYEKADLSMLQDFERFTYSGYFDSKLLSIETFQYQDGSYHPLQLLQFTKRETRKPYDGTWAIFNELESLRMNLDFCEETTLASLDQTKPHLKKVAHLPTLVIGDLKHLPNLIRAHSEPSEIHLASLMLEEEHNMAANLHQFFRKLRSDFPNSEYKITDGGFAEMTYGSLDFLLVDNLRNSITSPVEGIKSWSEMENGDYLGRPLVIEDSVTKSKIFLHLSNPSEQKDIDALNNYVGKEYGALFILGQGYLPTLFDLSRDKLDRSGFLYFEQFTLVNLGVDFKKKYRAKLPKAKFTTLATESQNQILLIK
jgi:hypothetical protein